MFDFEKDIVLQAEDFEIADRVAFVDGFLFSASVTLIYSPPKQGKTWLGYGVVDRISRDENISMIYYLDMDNSLSTLKERGIHESLMSNEKVKYITRARLTSEPIDLLRRIANEAILSAYDGVVFVVDTTKDFVDTGSTTQSKELLGYCTRMRDAGGTVIILHHATKNAKKISGDAVYTNTPDNVYELKQTGKLGDIINFSLVVKQARGLVRDAKYSVDTKTLALGEYDPIATGLNDAELKSVASALGVLRATPEGMSRRRLIEAMGYPPNDRTGIRLANELDGTKWKSVKKNAKLTLYYIIGDEDDSKTESV